MRSWRQKGSKRCCSSGGRRISGGPNEKKVREVDCRMGRNEEESKESKGEEHTGRRGIVEKKNMQGDQAMVERRQGSA